MSVADLVNAWSPMAAGWTVVGFSSVSDDHLSLTAGATSGAYTSHATSGNEDLTGSQLVTQLVSVPAWNGTAAEVWVQLIDTTAVVTQTWTAQANLGADGVFWLWTASAAGGTLHPGYRVGGVERWLAELPYAALGESWLRIRETAGVIYWETAEDGRTWTIRAAWAPVIDVTALRVDLRTGFWSPGTVPGVTTFGSVNVLPETEADPVTIITGDGMPFLAVDVIPELDAGTFLVALDGADTTGSYIDGDDLLGWATLEEGAWTNVVCDVTEVHIRRGSTRLQGVRTRAEAGTCQVRLTDTLRRFDPMTNADAIHPNTPVRVRTWGYDVAGESWDAVLFTGTINDLPVTYRKDDAPEVVLQSSDVIADLVDWRASGYEQPGIGAGDDLLGRATRMLEEMGRVPADVLSWDVDVVGYAASHPATVLAAPWAELTAAQDAELGLLWVDRNNRLTVRTRRSELSGPVRGTLSDVHGDADVGTVHVCYDALDAALGTEQTTNRAIGRRRVAGGGGDPATAMTQDTASGARWGWRVAEELNLELETDDQVTTWTQDLVAAGGTPELRVDRVMPVPSPVDLDSALDAWPAVCATDLGDRWAVRYHPEVGSAVDRTVGVLGIELSITPDGWTTVFHTTDAPSVTPGNPSGYFLLDESDLDSGDVLWPHSGYAATQRF